MVKSYHYGKERIRMPDDIVNDVQPSCGVVGRFH
jgi:hypothetical protein